MTSGASYSPTRRQLLSTMALAGALSAGGRLGFREEIAYATQAAPDSAATPGSLRAFLKAQVANLPKAKVSARVGGAPAIRVISVPIASPADFQQADGAPTFPTFVVPTSPEQGFYWIDSGRVNNSRGIAYKDEPIESGQDYFNLTLVSAYFNNKVTAWAEAAPTVCSLVTLEFGADSAGNPKTVSIPYLLGSPSMPGLQKAPLSNDDLLNVVRVNKLLTPTFVPFHGAKVSMTIWLTPVYGAPKVNSVLTLLGEISKIFVFPWLSQVVATGGVVSNAFNTFLTGAKAGAVGVNVGFDMDFVEASLGQNTLAQGYFVVIDRKTSVVPGLFAVKDDQLYYPPDIKIPNTTAVYKSASYMLFRIGRASKRNDWSALDRLNKPFNEAVGLLKQKKGDDAKRKLDDVFADLENSGDFTPTDATVIEAFYQGKYDDWAKRYGVA